MKDNCAFELASFDRRRDVDGREHRDSYTGFHIRAAAAVEHVIFDGRLVRWVRPLVAVTRRDDIDVSVQDDRWISLADPDGNLWSGRVRFVDERRLYPSSRNQS